MSGQYSSRIQDSGTRDQQVNGILIPDSYSPSGTNGQCIKLRVSFEQFVGFCFDRVGLPQHNPNTTKTNSSATINFDIAILQRRWRNHLRGARQ
jgi:hypothetical protein